MAVRCESGFGCHRGKRVSTTERLLECVALLMAACAVAAAAVGSHLLEQRWPEANSSQQFATATRMLFWHAIGLWICSRPGNGTYRQGILMGFSCFLFCFAVYSSALGIFPTLIFLAPVGGSGLICSWLWLFVSKIWKLKRPRE